MRSGMAGGRSRGPALRKRGARTADRNLCPIIFITLDARVALRTSGPVLEQGVGHGHAGDHQPSDRPWQGGRSRWIAGGLSILMICAVLSPVVDNWRERPQDNFPLSYYPMFTATRLDTQRETYLVGFDSQGNRYPIHHSYVGTAGMLQIRRQISQMAARGQAAQLCESVATAIARRRSRALSSVSTVGVMTGTYRYSEYFRGNKTPESEQARATCRVDWGRS